MAEEKTKKPMNRGTRTLLIVVCVIVGIALLLGAAVLILHTIGRNQLTDDGSGMGGAEGAEILGEGRVRYQGQLYQYKRGITTILLMGVDGREKPVSEGEFKQANQADVDVLMVLDPKSGNITLISLSRDAMCQIDITDDTGAIVGSARAQLALAYAYGDGTHRSCELTREAVSRVFYGLPISAYASIYLNGITDLVVEVGGVTVTSLETFGSFTQGQTVRLDRSNAEPYVRWRVHDTEGNNRRMERQKQVLMELIRTMLSRVRQRPTSILSTFKAVQRNVTTDLNAASMVYLARIASGMKLNNDVIKVQGESVLGAENHAEFNVDETALYELILSVFYEPIEG